ncbi:hypothetical protein DUNSADRAFT_6225, partial [Dunaliella salina]
PAAGGSGSATACGAPSNPFFGAPSGCAPAPDARSGPFPFGAPFGSASAFGTSPGSSAFAPSEQPSLLGKVHCNSAADVQEWWSKRSTPQPRAQPIPWLKWVQQQLASGQDTLHKLKTKEVQPFLPELEDAVSEAFASDKSFSKRARFHQLQNRAKEVLKKEYEQLMEACMEDLERVVAASCAPLFTPPRARMQQVNGQNLPCPEVLTVTPGPSSQPSDAIMGFILVQVVSEGC